MYKFRTDRDMAALTVRNVGSLSECEEILLFLDTQLLSFVSLLLLCTEFLGTVKSQN